MKPIEQIKKELTAFGKKYDACEEGIEVIKGDSIKELFENINKHINWCKNTLTKKEEFNAIFDNELIIEDGILFCNCTNLTSITIPESVTAIEKCAFYGCIELTSIIIPNSVTSIGIYAFAFCNGLTSIKIPNSVTLIRGRSFMCCSGLTSITIPESVISIGEEAFEGCRGLTSITIPNSVTSIEDCAFGFCRRDLKIIRK